MTIYSKGVNPAKAKKKIIKAIKNGSFVKSLKTFHKEVNTPKSNQSRNAVVDGNTSDGYHTFNELYGFRKLYNAGLFNTWYEINRFNVHKSKRYSDGEECFGGGWFIVMAILPTGQISNHYELKDWDLFQCEERELANVWDGHTPEDVAKRLQAYLQQPQTQSVGGEVLKQQLVDVEDLLTSFCADIYNYAHKKKETTGEYNEYFVTLEELDRVFTKFMENIKPNTQSRNAVIDRQVIEDEVYKKVGSWYKVPIREGMKSENVKGLGAFRGGGCEVCGGKLVEIRGRYPQDKSRKVCPTCAVEIIEGILDNCNNRQAYTESALKETK